MLWPVALWNVPFSLASFMPAKLVPQGQHCQVLLPTESVLWPPWATVTVCTAVTECLTKATEESLVDFSSQLEGVIVAGAWGSRYTSSTVRKQWDEIWSLAHFLNFFCSQGLSHLGWYQTWLVFPPQLTQSENFLARYLFLCDSDPNQAGVKVKYLKASRPVWGCTVSSSPPSL